MTTVKHIDELSDFHLRDITKLKPNTAVLFGHVPVLGEDPSLGDSKIHASGSLVTVTRVDTASFGDLHRTASTADWAAEKSLKVFYKTADSEMELYREAGDTGVVPYDEGWRNPWNFVVLISDLEAAGITLDLEPSDSLREYMEDYNSKVRVISFDYDLEELDVNW